MNAKRAVALTLALAVLATGLFLLLGRKQPAKPARRDAVATTETERPRRPRAMRPRPAVPQTREASVAVPATAQTSTRARALEATVLQAAVRHDWLVIDEHDTPCPPQKVRVVYDAPAELDGYEKGAYFEPLGPGPGDSDSEVNGLLLCEGSTFLYRGFEAYYRADRGQWEVFPFPVIE